MLHSAALTYLVEGAANISFSAEMSNVTHERAFDYFGVQRPGRALSFKAAVEY